MIDKAGLDDAMVVIALVSRVPICAIEWYQYRLTPQYRH